MLLSRMLIFADDSLYAEYFATYPREILEYIVSREKKYQYQDFFAYVVEKLHEEGKNSTEILAYLDSQENDALINEGDEYEEKLLEALMFDENKRI